jgi:hypothetical protein
VGLQLLLLAALVLSFVFGATRLPWWAAVIFPVVCIGVGVGSVMTEPENYDMHGFGYYIGGFLAAACVCFWFGGRAFARQMRG